MTTVTMAGRKLVAAPTTKTTMATSHRLYPTRWPMATRRPILARRASTGSPSGSGRKGMPHGVTPR